MTSRKFVALGDVDVNVDCEDGDGGRGDIEDDLNMIVMIIVMVV